MEIREEARHPTRWGAVAGLLVGCLLTLISIAFQHEPETVLFRSLIGGAIVGCVVGGSARVYAVLLKDDEEY